MDLLHKGLSPDLSYSDSITTYWKILTLDYLYRYSKLYAEYKHLLKNELELTKIEAIKKELKELRREIVSVIVSLISAIYPHLLQLYYANRKKLSNYPDEVRKWIKLIAEKGPEYLESFLLQDSEKIEEKDLLEVVASLGVVLVELNLIPIESRFNL